MAVTHIASFRTNSPNRDAVLAAAPILRFKGTEDHPRAKARGRTRNVERPGKATLTPECRRMNDE
jgi:hypothetical protein